MEDLEIKRLQDSVKNKLFSIFGSSLKDFEKVASSINFLGTIADFNVIRTLYNNSNKLCAEEDLNHLAKALERIQTQTISTSDKFDFSEKCLQQILDFSHNQRFRGKELLQATYMTIFSRYNDNRDNSNNIIVNKRLTDEVIRPEHKSEIGKIYITYDRYKRFLEKYQEDNAQNSALRKIRHNKRLVRFVLKKIRNNIAHGNFSNITEDEKQIVSIKSTRDEGFESKFEFKCVNSICEEILRQVPLQNSDILFQLKENLINGTPDKIYYENRNDEDTLMSIMFPLYINSFMIYNFNELKDLKNARRNATGKKLELIQQFFDRQNDNSFFNRVIDYNDDYTISDFEVFRNIRNSVVHNNITFQHGCVTTENGIKIPYEIFYDLLKNQEMILKRRNQNKENNKDFH